MFEILAIIIVILSRKERKIEDTEGGTDREGEG